jgi:hypothetical protein
VEKNCVGREERKREAGKELRGLESGMRVAEDGKPV